MADTATCPKCGHPYDSSKATCPYCGHTQWGAILPGLIFGLVCVVLAVFVAPGISSPLLRGVVRWGGGILGGLALLGSLMMIREAVFHKNVPFPEPPPPSAPIGSSAPGTSLGEIAAEAGARGPASVAMQPDREPPGQAKAEPPKPKPPAPKVEPWNRPAPSGQAPFIRMVPIVGGKLHRYGFVQMQVKGREIGKLVNSRSGFFSSPNVRLELQDKKIMAKTDRDDVFVNDELLARPRQLQHGDRITLGKDKNKAEYEFQMHPQRAKARRREEECAQGILRHAPDFSDDQKPISKLNEVLSISEEQLFFRKYKGGTQVHWKKLDEVRFIVHTGHVEAGGPLEAALAGGSQGIEAASSAFASEQESDHEAVFKSPAYTVEFRSRGEVLGKLDAVHWTACALIDQAVEAYAPMDLVKFSAM